MSSASFLNPDRFRKSNKNYALDYEGNLCWYDGQIDEKINLQDEPKSSILENAQYLPQRYIEDVCNDLGNEFKKEINNVIFSYVDIPDRGNTTNLNDLIKQKSGAIEETINNKLKELNEINISIINLENKLTDSYLITQNEGLNKCKEKLQRHSKSKPSEVEKSSEGKDPIYLEELSKLDCEIDKINKSINNNKKQLTEININIDSLTTALTRVQNAEQHIEKVNKELEQISIGCDEEKLFISANFESIIKNIQNKIKTFNDKKTSILSKLSPDENADSETSLIKKLDKYTEQRQQLISKSDAKEKEYQKYIEDLKYWTEQKEALIGDSSNPHLYPNSLEFYKSEIYYIKNNLKLEYEEKCNMRFNIIHDIFKLKKQVTEIYSSIYLPVQKQLENLINDMEDKINFVSELSISNKNIGSELLSYINKSYSGIFNGSAAATSTMSSFIKQTNFNDWDSTKLFISNILRVISENYDLASKKVPNREDFYLKLCGLKYIDAQYSLKMGGKNLNELSPGEKGILLLIFYLALSKDERPLIIDQPEDNLDNQSVYSKLVKCITEAKKKRQVIIVTHNPNIAVACDSEQIIYCTIDKSNNSISYSSGSIENPSIRQHVIDVLEGTMPAFDLRRKKYQVND